MVTDAKSGMCVLQGRAQTCANDLGVERHEVEFWAMFLHKCPSLMTWKLPSGFTGSGSGLNCKGHVLCHAVLCCVLSC